MRVLVTGAAGHIGAEVVQKLSESNTSVLGVDSFTDFYSANMKKHRIEALGIKDKVLLGDITDTKLLDVLFSEFKPTHVINLAARAGVRSTWDQFHLYNHSNVVGFQTVLETAVSHQVEHFLFASSSSVYGEGLNPPYSEESQLNIPKSYYALTKIANEISAKAASAVMKTTGLRFFTVYGPWGRPDMATLQFVAAGLLNRPATLTGDLSIKRDFTYVSDAAQIVIELLDRKDGEKFEILNVAGGRPQSLNDLIQILAEEGLEFGLNSGTHSSLDVPLTHGSTEKLSKFVTQTPQTSLSEGIQQVIAWAKSVDSKDLSTWIIPPIQK
jgi:UDP-glucuronate 4-epimerase